MKNENSVHNWLSEDDKKKITDVINSMRFIPNEESSFSRLELLFYNVLNIARTYGTDVQENAMLAGLKLIEENEYKHTQERFKKSRQRVVVIQKFRNAFKREISSWMKVKYAAG